MNENQNDYVDINAHDNYPDSEQKIEVPTMKVIPLKKICMTIGQLPTAYLETMSYYEMLIWFIEYLKNNIIPTINNNASAVQEVQSVVLSLQEYINNYKDSIDSDVEELEEYMNNYFNNLDVQEEINNKLDKMTESGTLQEIIADYLNSKAVFGFDNVASMKTATNLIDGSYARTLGFYSKNDGGGSLYKIRTVTNDDVINEMDIIEMSDSENNLIAELINDKNNVMCYGVSINDSNNNNHTIIKYVIDKMKKAICDTEISLNNTLVIDSNDVEFDFKKINYNGNTHAILLNNSNVVLNGEFLNSNYDGLRLGLSNLTMFCNIKINRLSSNNIGVLLGGSAGVYYDTIDITRLDYKTNGVKCLLDDYHVGEITFYNTAFSDTNDDTIERFAFHCHATNYRATGFKFYNCSIEGSHGGFYFEGIGKLCEYIEAFGLRATEASFKNYKVLKIKCNQTTIPLYGDIFFDNAKPSSFDFSEYTVAENSSLMLHGSFRDAFNSSNDLLGYEGHPAYTRLVLTKLPRGYDVVRTSDNPVLLQATSIVGLPPSGQTTPNTLKLKIGDSNYTYNGHLQIFVDNTNITSVDIYASDGTTLARSIPISGKTIINAEFTQLLTSAQTQMIYSISNNGATSTFS